MALFHGTCDRMVLEEAVLTTLTSVVVLVVLTVFIPWDFPLARSVIRVGIVARDDNLREISE